MHSVINTTQLGVTTPTHIISLLTRLSALFTAQLTIYIFKPYVHTTMLYIHINTIFLTNYVKLYSLKNLSKSSSVNTELSSLFFAASFSDFLCLRLAFLLSCLSAAYNIKSGYQLIYIYILPKLRRVLESAVLSSLTRTSANFQFLIIFINLIKCIFLLNPSLSFIQLYIRLTPVRIRLKTTSFAYDKFYITRVLSMTSPAYNSLTPASI